MRHNSHIIRLPKSLQRRLEDVAGGLFAADAGPKIDFAFPAGENALVAHDSISWRAFKNPISLFIGGIAAVILELAEPSVREGVWEHSSFRTDPMRRLRRTGLAAMVTVYGAHSVAEPIIARVVQMHAKVAGQTAAGLTYSANDVRLLSWVHATASFGFASAYNRYVCPLSEAEIDDFYREGVPAAQLYGARDAPKSCADVKYLLQSMRGRLEPSPVIFEFLTIMRTAPAFPRPLRWIQGMLVRAAVEMVPDRIREDLGLTEYYGLRPRELSIVGFAGALADRIVVLGSPAVQSCLRLGLPIDHLYA